MKAVINNDKQNIELLKRQTEQMFGRQMATPKDFSKLAENIFNRIHVQVSPTTLKRIWGYLDEPVATRVSTLNILSQFLGYSSWDSFCENAKGSLEPQSNFIINKMVSTETIPPHAHIRLTWAPGRVCEIVHEGSGLFSVVRSERTKLLAGDTFECRLFIEKEPLYLYNLIHQGQKIPAYVAGKQEGVYFEYIND